MERTIGMDVHAASCTLAVISEKGRKLRDFVVETNGQALVEAIRMGAKRIKTPIGKARSVSGRARGLIAGRTPRDRPEGPTI